VYLCVSVSPWGYLWNYTCDLHQICGACCLQLWLDLTPANGVKSAIYDCPIIIICLKTVIIWWIKILKGVPGRWVDRQTASRRSRAVAAAAPDLLESAHARPPSCLFPPLLASLCLLCLSLTSATLRQHGHSHISSTKWRTRTQETRWMLIDSWRA